MALHFQCIRPCRWNGVRYRPGIGRHQIKTFASEASIPKSFPRKHFRLLRDDGAGNPVVPAQGPPEEIQDLTKAQLVALGYAGFNAQLNMSDRKELLVMEVENHWTRSVNNGHRTQIELEDLVARLAAGKSIDPDTPDELSPEEEQELQDHELETAR